MTMNTDRISTIDGIAETYQRHSGKDRTDQCVDMLADLQHWCVARSVDFSRSLAMSRLHFAVETDAQLARDVLVSRSGRL